MDRIIIKSNINGQENWSGKEFSDLPAKVYTSFADAVVAIGGYWLTEFNPEADNRAIIFKPLTHSQTEYLIKTGNARL
jgi:hypothetical protein